MEDEVKKSADAQEQEKDLFVISSPDPLPEDKNKITAFENDAEDEIERKTKTNRIPKPAPKKADTTAAKSEAPMSSNTVSIRRSELKGDFKPDAWKKLKIACYHCGQKLDLSEMKPFSEIECPSCSVKIIVPKWFDNYLLEEPGGEGGMATVYRALDLTLDREVAIKILNSSFSTEADRSQLFLHEARTAATINHYAVIPVYTCGNFEEQPYIVMQFMDGGSLEAKLDKANGRLPINQALKWVKDVADGLDNARRHGIIHHDVKPANILLDNDGNAKVGDFGIAQALYDWRSENISKITRTWASPNYVSPEKVSSGQENYYGDIYSLGISFFQLLTGKFPFEHPDMQTMVRMRLEQDPPDPKGIRPEIPLKIAKLILAMIERNPDKRPSYREIISEIEETLKLSDGIKKIPDTAAPKKKIAKTSKKIPVGMSSALKTEKPKASPYKIFMHIAISALMIGIAVLLWKSGCIEDIVGRKGSFTKSMPEDLIPEATSQLKAGNPAKAYEIAKQILEAPDSSIKEKRQAAIQTALSIYLRNLPNAKTECLSIAERISNAGMEEDDPALVILRFLSNGDVYAEKLKTGFDDDEFYRLVAGYSLYIKAIFNKSTDIEIVSLSRRCAAGSNNMSDEFWGNAWKQRINVWKECVEYGKIGAGSLEPLIAANKYEIKTSAPSSQNKDSGKNPNSSREKPKEKIVDAPRNIQKTELDTSTADEKNFSKINIAALTAEWLENDRKSFAGGRIRPSDYNFNMPACENYVASIEESRRPSETVRLGQVAGMKNYLCSLTAKMSYNKSFQTSKGKIMSGPTMANPNYISVRIKNEYKRVRWDELPPAELSKIIAYYADLRTRVSAGVAASASQQKKEAAQDYLRIAMLCDWYGDYAECVKYCEKAVSTDKEIERSVKKFIME
jgi:DNA-directed RNA polymerase subunit RPC12/RpoP